MTKKTIYEQPLNERIRTFMRLEFLFAQAAHHLRGKDQWDSRCSMTGLLEIMSIFGRSDLKTEVIKELERHQTTLGQLQRNPEVDNERLEQVIRDLDRYSGQLLKHQGPIAAELKGNEFLSSIQQRSAVPGGTCAFDLPAFHHWLQQPAARRVRDLAGWLGQYETIASAIQLVLKLIRESTPLKAVVAEQGFYQMSMNPNSPGQLVRVAVPDTVSCFAEISGGRHRFTVRFLKYSESDGHTHQIPHNLPFEISCCQI